MPETNLLRGHLAIQGGPKPLLSYPVKATIAQVLAVSADAFDFFLIIALSPILSKILLPPKTPPLLGAALIILGYGLTGVIRPVGGALFGSLADKFGRRNLVIVTVLGIGLASSTTGLLPTYVQAGFAGIILFSIIRGMIGLFLGGEYAAGYTFSMEWVRPKYRGLIGGLIQGGFGLGVFFSGIASLAFSDFFGAQNFASYGWRFAFFATLIPMAIAFFIRMSLNESPMFSRLTAEGKKEKSPFLSLFKRPHVYNLIQMIFLMAGAFLLYNGINGYLSVILTKAPSILTLSLVAGIITFEGAGNSIGAIVYGTLSQYIGRRRFGMLGSLLGILLIAPLTYYVVQFSTVGDVISVMALVFAIGFLTNGPFGILTAYATERFGTAQRASGTGFGYNGGYLIAAWFSFYVLYAHNLFADIEGLNIWLSAAFVSSIGAALMGIGFFAGPETSKLEFEKEFQQRSSS